MAMVAATRATIRTAMLDKPPLFGDFSPAAYACVFKITVEMSAQSVAILDR